MSYRITFLLARLIYLLVFFLYSCDQLNDNERGVFIEPEPPKVIASQLNFKDIIKPDSKVPVINFEWSLTLETFTGHTNSKIKLELILIKGAKQKIVTSENIEISNLVGSIVKGDLTAKLTVSALELFAIEQEPEYISWQLKVSHDNTNYTDVISDHIYLANLDLTETDKNNIIHYFKSSDNSAADNFGQAVQISDDGEVIVAGSPNNNKIGNAYIFKKTDSDWQQIVNFQQQNLISGKVSSEFSRSISLSADGKVLAISSLSDNDNKGIVFIYRIDTVNNLPILIKTIESLENDDDFGRSMSLSKDGKILAVGAPKYHDSQGNIYIYSADNNYEQEQKLVAFNYGIGDEFGNALVVSNDGKTLAIGARYEDSKTDQKYILNKEEGDTFTKPNSNEPGGNNNDKLSGAVYIFEYLEQLGWIPTAFIKPNDSIKIAQFGTSLDLTTDNQNNSTLIVGAPERDRITSSSSSVIPIIKHNSGSVYLFKQTNKIWRQIRKIDAPNYDSTDKFGNSVSISTDGQFVFIGSIYESENSRGIHKIASNLNQASGSGAVYVYQKN